MLNRQVQFFNQRLAFFLFWALLPVTLQCCGSVTHSKSEVLVVQLELPAGDDPTLFWFGIKKKALKIHPTKGSEQELEWLEGSRLEVDLREGDQIEFLGTDENGRLIVSGQTIVGEEKKVTIPLRRVL